ncbi:nucleoside deaminase [Pseudorhodoferax soli]|uniref:Cytidine/deoxycytidylate deaminase-like protein n=1 Tax=Pseudorhodoferax soli TaxID=545864 RepID=A0A368YBX7_9BURK|nr:nucleoside deaminase [Pseudorhodoferax soli]RCW76357.1 cytidine/deoxycytidylate deaminase-like protein [Pseudorhodoferax soli]
MTDAHWMRLALDEAEDAYARGDWPTGAVLVKDGELLGRGQNRQVSQGDPTLHAEPDALRQAFAAHGPAAAQGATLYCTMEPCPMCAGALKLAGVGTLVLALRHATLRRSDLGDYSIERFCALTGHAMALRDGVLEADYLALRLRWGGDRVRPA